jgi:hypothetical protein
MHSTGIKQIAKTCFSNVQTLDPSFQHGHLIDKVVLSISLFLNVPNALVPQCAKRTCSSMCHNVPNALVPQCAKRQQLPHYKLFSVTTSFLYRLLLQAFARRSRGVQGGLRGSSALPSMLSSLCELRTSPP